MRDPTSLPEAIRQELDANDWSQTDLADHYGVAPATVSRWLRGETYPRMRYWLMLSVDLGVDIPTIAAWTEPHFNSKAHLIAHHVGNLGKSLVKIIERRKRDARRSVRLKVA